VQFLHSQTYQHLVFLILLLHLGLNFFEVLVTEEPKPLSPVD
jgi:hypothetical protein